MEMQATKYRRSQMYAKNGKIEELNMTKDQKRSTVVQMSLAFTQCTMRSYVLPEIE